MHIGIDASRATITARTGTERYSYELIGALARHDRRNRYTLYCNGIPPTLPPLGSNVHLRSIPFPRLWTHLRLSLELRHHPPDVLFVPSHVLPLYHPPRSVVTVHDLGYLAFPATHTLARRLDLHLTTLWSARTAWRIIAISHATKGDLVSRYAINPQNIYVVYHGLAPQFRPVTDQTVVAAAQARYHIGTCESAPRYLLYVGTVQPRKNLVRLIDAFAEAIDGRTGQPALPGDLVLVIAGKRGWLTETIEQRAAQAGIANRVHFTGYVDDADLPALLSGALAFVFPSLYEGFGMPVLEAMACGTPVLTSTTSSLPEVAGDAALLVDPHDTQAIASALARLANDPDLCSDLCTRGLQRAAHFTWQQCASETLRVLLLGER